MKSVRTFCMDFAGFFIITVGGLLVCVMEVLMQIIHMLHRLYDQVMVPGAVELLADANMLLLIAYQGYLEIKSNMCLMLSQWLLGVAKRAHVQSEQLIDKTWMH